MDLDKEHEQHVKSQQQPEGGESETEASMDAGLSTPSHAGGGSFVNLSLEGSADENGAFDKFVEMLATMDLSKASKVCKMALVRAHHEKQKKAGAASASK